MAHRKTESHLVFVVGGASSGKSEVALQLACKGISKNAPRAFVATGEGLDAVGSYSTENADVLLERCSPQTTITSGYAPRPLGVRTRTFPRIRLVPVTLQPMPQRYKDVVDKASVLERSARHHVHDAVEPFVLGRVELLQSQKPPGARSPPDPPRAERIAPGSAGRVPDG